MMNLDSKKYLILGAMCWPSLSNIAHAQATFSIGPQVGVNTMTCRFVGNPNVYATPYLSSAYRVGLEAGIQAEVAFKHFAFQPALRFAQQGFKLQGSYSEGVNGGMVFENNVDQQYRLNYLIIPLNVAYKFRADGQGGQLFAGGYASALVGGQARFRNTTAESSSGYHQTTETSPAIKTGAEAKNDGNEYFQRYDAGIQAGVGYRYQGVLIQAGYLLGLANTGVAFPFNPPEYRDGPKYHNRGFQLLVSYLFKHK